MEKQSKIALILSIVSLAGAIANGICTFVCKPQPAQSAPAVEGTVSAGNIVYFNMDEVIADYQMAIDLQESFQAKASGIDQEVTRRRTKLENEDKELSDKLNKGLMTRSTAEIKYQDLQKKVADFQNYAQQKQNELAEEQQVILNNIADAINSYLKVYNARKGYSMIFSTSGDLLAAPVTIADEPLNITEDLVSGLNEEYAQSKKK